MKSGIKALARRAGYEITKADDRSTMDSAFARLAPRFAVATVVDVGASDGRWSRMARRHYPDAQFLLFEAQAEPHTEGLERFAAESDHVAYVLAAAGESQGEIHFDASDPFSGVASTEPTGEHDVIVPMTTVDAEVKARSLPGPYLVKLDTHGFEEFVLNGASDTLGAASLAVIEAYNFELMDGSMRFHQLCVYMEERGMRVIDLVDIMRRPGDGVLWQFDLFFARAERPEFTSNSYA